MSDYDDRSVAFDSNILTYFLDGNRGDYSLAPDDPLRDQRVAAVRLFLFCKPVIVPTVRAEASRIVNPTKAEEHMRFIENQFAEFNPDEQQAASIERRADELLRHHPKGTNDCRILAEVEEDGGIPVLVTWDKDFRGHLASRTCIRLEAPVECWEGFNIPRGSPLVWTPAPGHPLANETWWRWQ
jgi:predicted nucleic acid-binding protein